MKFNVWKDGEKSEAITVEADNISDALDAVANEFGYIDYADMAQELGWDSDNDDGLNIEDAE